MSASNPPSTSERRGALAALSAICPIWPTYIYWLGLVVVTTTGIQLIGSNSLGNLYWPIDVAFFGLILSQFGLAAILGGLIARSWITSWFVSVALACFQTALSAFVHYMCTADTTGSLEQLALCSYWPIMLLATSTPLVGLRLIYGWTLSRQEPVAIPRWRSSLEDLLLVGVIIACSMTILQVILYSEGPQNLPEMLLGMGIMAVLSMTCVTPTVYVTFRARNWGRRIVGWMLLAVFTLAVVFAEDSIIEPDVSLRNLPGMLVGVPTACLTVALGLISLLASGYRLTYFEKTSSAARAASVESNAVKEVSGNLGHVGDERLETEWLDDSLPVASKRMFDFGPKWQARAITMLMICVAMASAGGLASARKRLTRFYDELDSSGFANVNVNNRTLTGIHFAPEFTDADLRKYIRYAPTITSLSFAGTKVTDAIVPELKAFEKLVILDLSNTAISDDGLRQLHMPPFVPELNTEPPGWQKLTLSHTKVTWDAVRQLAQRMPIQQLDLEALGITDEQLKSPIQVKDLSLARNPITDEGVESLLQNQGFLRLDLADTAVTGVGFNKGVCPKSLILDGTRVDDATLLTIIAKGDVTKLSLARTEVTAAVLPKLYGFSLRLGQGKISESDFRGLKSAFFQQLALNDKKFTGECVANGTVNVNALDLSDSGVTDKTAASILTGRYFQYVGLANTPVGDNAIRNVSVNEIDVRGTQVTAKALSRMPNHFRVIVSHKQFSPNELIMFEHAHVDIAERSRHGTW